MEVVPNCISNVACRFPYQLGGFVFGSNFQCNQGILIHNLLRSLLSTWAQPITVYGLLRMALLCCFSIICSGISTLCVCHNMSDQGSVHTLFILLFVTSCMLVASTNICPLSAIHVNTWKLVDCPLV
jgi:hypothetical protein